MAREEFSIDVDISDVIDAMDTVAEKGTNTGPLMDVVADILLEGVLDNYDREQNPEGKWPDLAPETQSERRRKGYGANTPKLVRTRQLRSSLQPFSSADAAEVGTNKIYAPIQFLGGKPGMPPGAAGIPRRNPLWINDETSREIDAEVDDWFDDI